MEAIATCYLPLLELLDAGAPLTVSLTPVLCDQLEAPGVGERFVRFVEEVRRHTHDEDTRGLRKGGHETLARVGGEQRQHRVRGRGGPLDVGCECREQVFAARAEALQRMGVLAPGPFQLPGTGGTRACTG